MYGADAVNNDGVIDLDDFDYFADAAIDYMNFRANPANEFAVYSAPAAYRQDLGQPD